MERLDVLVAGGGISGLGSAWWLARGGRSVAVWEADARTGGKICSTRHEGYLTERAASMVLNFRPEVSELLREIGLEAEQVARNTDVEARRYLLQRGRLHALPMRVGAMVASPLWSLRGKLRLLAEPFVPRGGSADESVGAFIVRRLGHEMLDKAIEPFVAGTLASDPHQTCAAAALPRLTALERRYGSLAAGVLASRILRRRTASRPEVFSFGGGIGEVVDRLTGAAGVQVLTGHEVVELAPLRDGWRVTARTPRGDRIAFARDVVLTTPAAQAAALVSAVDDELATLLRGIEYAAVAVVHLGLARDAVRHPLDGTGFLAPKAEMRSLTGSLWMSSLFPGRAPPGRVLLTSYLGGARASGVCEWDDGRLVDETLAALRPLLGLNAPPEMVRIDRHQRALPQYHGRYAARLQAIEERVARLRGLHLDANYLGGVSVRDRLARGRALAARVAAARRTASDGVATPGSEQALGSSA